MSKIDVDKYVKDESRKLKRLLVKIKKEARDCQGSHYPIVLAPVLAALTNPQYDLKKEEVGELRWELYLLLKEYLKDLEELKSNYLNYFNLKNQNEKTK